MRSYTRSEAADRTGLSTDTIRYYERIGLVPPVARGPAGKRCYSDVDLTWLDLVHCLRDVGMPITEISHFTALMQGGDASVAERLAALRVQEERIQAQMSRLDRRLKQIRAKVQLYEGGEPWSPVRKGEPEGAALRL